MAMNMLERAKPRSAILAGAKPLTVDEIQTLAWPTAPPDVGDTADNEPRTDLDGLRVAIPGAPEIYLIDRGYRRWIPDPPTYNDLFMDWDDIQSSADFAAVPLGTQIAIGSYIAQAAGEPAVYFIDGFTKRHIITPGVLTYWDFTSPRLVDESLIVELPDGPDIENAMACFTATSAAQQGASMSLIGSADAISGFDDYDITVPDGCPALCISMVAPLTENQPVDTSFVLTAPDGSVYQYTSVLGDDYIGETNATGLVNFFQESPVAGTWNLAVTAFQAEAFWAEVLLLSQVEGEAVYQTVLDDFTDNAPMVRDALQSILGDDTSPADYEAHRAEFRVGGSLALGGWWGCWTCKAVIIVVAVVVIALVIGTIPESAPVVLQFVRCALALRVVLSAGAAATILNGLSATGIPHVLELICLLLGICG